VVYSVAWRESTSTRRGKDERIQRPARPCGYSVTIREWETCKIEQPRKPLTDTLAPNKPYLAKMKDGTFAVVWWVVTFTGKGKNKRWIGSGFYFIKKPKATRDGDSKPAWPEHIWELPGVRYAKPRCITHDVLTGKKKPYHS